MLLSPGDRLGAYEIVSLIGEGGMGEVYRARDIALNRIVAIKVLGSAALQDDTAKQRLLREARTISKLDHPNICPLYHFGHDRGTDYLVMQYLEGETLAAVIRRGALPVKTALTHATEIAAALQAAHERGIIHRDLKPANVMITGSGAKLLDFGLAIPRPRAEASLSADTLSGEAILTRPGTLLGTLPYMAPEQLEGHPPDARSDIFSFGTVFYEMLTGRRPFVRTSQTGVMTAILGFTPLPPSRVNPAVPAPYDAIVMRCLAKTPSLRWQTMRELLTALTQAAHGPHSSWRRRRWHYAAGVGIVAASIALMVATVPRLLNTRAASRSAASGVSDVVVAILPFDVESPDPAERAFWAGMSEALAAKLMQLPAAKRVNVIPSADLAARSVATPVDARVELGATRVLRARMGTSEGGFRSVLELVDVGGGEMVRTASVSLVRENPAASQNRLVDAVLSLLDVHLTARERARLITPEGRASAYDLYLQALGYMQDDAPEKAETAISILNEALVLDSEHAPAHAALGRAYWRKYESTRDGKWVETARQSCERALGLDEAEAAPHMCLATVENGIGRYERAIQEYQHAIEREPDNENAYIGLAEAYHKLNDLPKAEQTYKQAIAQRPNYWRSYSMLGAFYYSTGRYLDAENAFRQVIALNPDGWRAYSNLGAVQYIQGRSRDAMASYEKSMALRPNSAAASNLGTLYFYELADYQRAATAFQQAIDIDETRHDLWGNLAWAFHWAGDTARARTAFEKATALAEERRRVNPRDAAVLMSLAEYRAALGDRASARRLMMDALSIAPDEPRLMYRAGVLYEFAFADREQALKWLAAALDKGYSRRDVERDPALSRFRNDGGLQRLQQTAESQ